MEKIKDMGTCKHGTFPLRDGCEQCIAESRTTEAIPGQKAEPIIVKVRYFSETTGESSGREYTYFSVDPLKVGDIIQVPVRDRVQKAVVTAVGVPYSEIEGFRDKVKTIPSGSIMPAGPIEVSQEDKEFAELRDQNREKIVSAFGISESTLSTATDNKYCGHGKEIKEGVACFLCNEDLPEGVKVEQIAEKPSSLALAYPQYDTAINKIYQTALSLLTFARARNIVTLEDAEKATEDGTIINNYKKELEKFRKAYLAPFKVHVDKVNEAFKLLAAPLKEADGITRDKILAFNAKQREIQRKQEEINQLNIEAAKKQEELTGEKQEVEVIEVKKAPERIKTNLGMAGERLDWDYEIIDFALLDDFYKVENAKLIKACIVGSKGLKVPTGVRAFQKPTLTYR